MLPVIALAATSLPVFVPFGRDHLAALVLTAVVALGLSRLVRMRPGGALAARLSLAAFLAAATAWTLANASREAPLTFWDFVPLHLCDFLIVVAVLALVTRNQVAYELLYFWAGAGTLLAMLTPDVDGGFPDWRFLAFFVLHGAVVAAAVVLTLGVGMRPRPGAPLRVFLCTNVYAAVAAVVNGYFGTNFLYLRHKPRAETALDWLGPWPAYLFVVDALALALFLLLDLPFRAGRRSRDGERAPGR